MIDNSKRMALRKFGIGALGLAGLGLVGKALASPMCTMTAPRADGGVQCGDGHLYSVQCVSAFNDDYYYGEPIPPPAISGLDFAFTTSCAASIAMTNLQQDEYSFQAWCRTMAAQYGRRLFRPHATYSVVQNDSWVNPMCYQPRAMALAGTMIPISFYSGPGIQVAFADQTKFDQFLAFMEDLNQAALFGGYIAGISATAWAAIIIESALTGTLPASLVAFGAAGFGLLVGTVTYIAIDNAMDLINAYNTGQASKIGNFFLNTGDYLIGTLRP